MTDRRVPVDRYVVERTLGHGGMATVYLARDCLLDRRVALKVLAEHFASDEAFRDRFMREARLAAKLVHPNVVQVYDVGEDERGAFIVMEYVEGDTLADELRRRGRLLPAGAVAVGVQLCSALEAAHGERLVHRDIKPQNVLRRRDGLVKLADFGIARSLAGTSHTEIGTVLGTAAYLAPEQARGEPVTAAADIYSLGVVLYELMTGQTPFSAETLPELLLKREQDAVVPPSELATEVPANLEAVVMRCLALQPEFRPASAAALAGELAASISEQLTAPTPVSTGLSTEVLPATAATVPLRRAPSYWGRTLQVVRRRRLLAAAVAAAAALLALLLAVALTDSSTGRHSAGATIQLRSTTPTNTTPTAAAATTSATSTASTTRAQPPPATPAEAIANARAAISQALTSGQLNPGAGNDLNHLLDHIAQALANGSEDAAPKLADLVHHLTELANSRQLSSTGLAQINTPLNQLAALLALQTEHPGPPTHGDNGKHGKHGND